MRWFEDSKVVEELRNSAKREAWAETGALDALPEVMRRLPAELQLKDRMGPMTVQPIVNTDEWYCWMVPLDGSQTRGKILGPNHQVKLIDPEGNIFFDGLWGETPLDAIKAHDEFFIWLAPPLRTR